MSGLAVAQEEVTDEEASDESIEEIITTGSRIRKDVFSSSAPMAVVDVDEASLQGVANVGELLQNTTTAAGSAQVTSAITTEFVENGGIGTNTISLRGLGANRTLVLLNGRRAGPSGTRGGVSSFDLSVLPISTIERVEVLKDGASSIYGSDAVAGVVNIITRREDGGTLDGFISAPSGSGGEQTRLSASWGRDFDRGGFRVTADYNKQEELARGDRDYFSCGNDYVFNPDTGERADVIDPRTGNFKCSDLTWGHIWIYDYGAGNIPGGRRAQYDYDGDLGQYIPGYGPVESAADLETPPGWFPTGYDRASSGVENADHPFQDAQSLIPETEVTTFFGEGSYELSDSVELYGEALLNRRETYVNSYRQYWNYAYSGNFDFVNGFAGGSQLSAEAGWNGLQWFSPTAITDIADDAVTVDYQRFLAGLRGEFSNGWSWDATASYSTSDGEYWSQQLYNDSVRDQNWTTGDDSCVGQLTSVGGVPCVDVRWFSEDVMNGRLTQAERDYLFAEETGNTEYNQWSVDAFVSGELFDLPAGPLSIATGIHYRQDEIDDLPGPITLAGNVWGSTAAGNTVGDDTTQALFVEFDVPLVNDAPFMRDLTLNASARYTDVDSYGDDTTWKAGINWQIFDSVRIRANKGTSFRTPALFELYLADQTSFGQTRWDPCINYGEAFDDGEISQIVYDNCAADPAGLDPDYTGGTITPTVFTGGGLGVLKAETSESSTLGLIWQPSFADLSISIDYFDIEIKDEVAIFGAARILSGCYASETGFAGGGTEPLCTLFDRSLPNSGIDNIRDSYINIASQTNRGIDYALRYTNELGGWGNLRIDLEANRQIEDQFSVFTDDPDDLNKIVGDPEWVGQYSFSLARGAFEMFYSGRYVGQASNERFFSDNVTTGAIFDGETVRQVFDVDPVLYHALSAGYTYDDLGLRVLVGVANLTNEEPPQVSTVGTNVSTVGNSAFYSQYDWLGRRAFMNLTWNFD
jgi:iron complex outermembrane receptor protein